MNKKKTTISLICAGSLVVAGVAIFLGIYIPHQAEWEDIYKKANVLLYDYKLDESEELFQKIYKYKDSAAKIGVIHGIKTLNETGNYNKAIDATVETGGIIEVDFTTEGTPVDPITITEKTTIDAKSYIEHYDFLKWNILSYYLIEDSHSFQLNLYSTFAPHVYTIDYDVGEGFVVDPVRKYTYGTSVTATNAYRDGYTFTGYTVGDDETLYNPFVVKETDGENFMLTAHYTPNQYTYTFDAMGGTCDTTERTYTYDEVYRLPVAEKDGYDFAGWYTDYDKKLDEKINIYHDVTLYARYTPKQFAINYDLRGGQFLDTYPTGYNYESEDISIPYPNREGYLFAGWVEEEQESKVSEVNYVIPTGSQGDKTLHACWRKYTSDFGNSYIKSLDDFDLPAECPISEDEIIPGYVIPYNISSFDGRVFDDQAIDGFGVEKKNSFFATAGDGGKYLVDKGKTALYMAAFSDFSTKIDLNLPSSIVEIKDSALSYAPESLTKVGNRAFACSTIENFNAPNAEIYEDEAFAECHELVNINDSLSKATRVGDKAFFDTGLTSVVVGDDVEYLGPLSFGGSTLHHDLTNFECLSTKFDSLEKVFMGQTGTISLTLGKVPTSVKDMFNSTNVHLDTVRLVDVTDLPDEFIYEIPPFTELITTTNILYVGDRAFAGAEGRLVPALNKATHIGESAFENCSDLGEVVLEDITYIGENAFKDSGLTKINLPESLEYIGDGAFAGCEQLEKLVFASPRQVEKIGNINRLFGEHTFASNLDIEVRGEGTLPEKAFQNLYVGKGFTLGQNVSLSKFAFNNATSIQYVHYSHERNTIIPVGCFESVSCLKSIDLTGIVKVESFAFNNCTSLTSFTDGITENTFGETLHAIGNQAFGNLMKIDHIEIKNPTIEYGNSVFANNTFELWVYSDTQISSDALRDFQGAIYTL